MEAYTGFAQVYDKFMDNIEYDKWCEYLGTVGRQGLRYDWRGLLPGNA